MNSDLIKRDWHSREDTASESSVILQDRLGLTLFIRLMSLVVLAEGEIEVEIEGKLYKPKIVEKCLSLLMLIRQ